MQNYVFVIDTNKQPLNPIPPKKARRLLDKGKAAVFRMYPFTIILKTAILQSRRCANENPVVTNCQLKIDPGSQVTGFALVQNNQVIWGMELEHRGGLIKKKLESRRAVRHRRRNRNTRYRKPRFLNRKRSEGWLPPSLEHRILTIETWVKRLIKFCPVNEIWIERVKFDAQKMQNPEISGVEYQQGERRGYEVREYLLEKWGRECTYCGKQSVPLQIEHIHPKSKGGSNRVSNLCLACEKCNQRKGNKPIEEFLNKKPSLLQKIKTKAKQPLKDAAAVNATRQKLVKVLRAIKSVVTGTGAQTKYNRTKLGFPKEHWIDAACVGDIEPLWLRTNQPLLVTCKGQGGRQKAALNKYGYPIRHNPLKPIKGWCSGDIAKNVLTGEFGRVNPRSKSNSFNYTVPGKKAVSLHVKNLTKVHKKDGYVYNFCK
ncbi:MAG: HNH endonuclease [Moorea sp. SIO1F2]|uniref:RNA-guided endonuclease IscB n=1 Tax=unclassified Moorena TaxID=2683338 RepID=UPI0013BE89AF|nr:MULTISPECIES: RNA-guided endonuclease IscB [unclassified Moorena]NEO00972.1 HNH endonuclease [Moorena sp. SIO3I7]NEO05143.1 HNH endonuclease [Moorena sp. SIO3I8]NEO18917.1 HNH endonuclease [Moorena sp. SIO4A5]NEP21044.1 HNH endonuclease [Moorena sp. SIO3I6]NEQ56120.1 HNH endonuclease [Moorena sp. SIO4A1]